METVTTTPRARVRHICEVCGWAVTPGEVYTRTITFDGGDVLTWKAHVTPCTIATDRAWIAGYDDSDIVTAEAVAEWAHLNADTDEIAADLEDRLRANSGSGRIFPVTELVCAS